MLHRSRLIHCLLVGILCAFGADSAGAQDFPVKPIRLVVANTPGSSPDLIARIIGPEMSRALGQPIIVENRPGADQLIGLEYVAKQVPADGYTTLVVAVPGLSLLPVTVKELRFNPLKDLPPVAGLVEGRLVFGSPSQAPWKTFNEFVAHAKANPGKLNYGSSSPYVRLLCEMLFRGLGVNIVHVPYSGAGPAYKALIANEVEVGIVGESALATFGDKFRALAVTGEQRLAYLRDLPTFTELGFPQMSGQNFSLNAPAGMPKAAFDKLYAAAARTLQQPEVRANLAKIQFEVSSDNTPETAARTLAQQAGRFADIAKQIGLQPQ